MNNTNTDSAGEMLEADLVYRIMGCAFEVLKEVGHGLHEKPYENAMAIAMDESGMAVGQQERYPIMFRDKVIGEYIPDLVADDAVIIDAKVIDRITDHERGQMLNYLKIPGLRVGVGDKLQTFQTPMGARNSLTKSVLIPTKR